MGVLVRWLKEALWPYWAVKALSGTLNMFQKIDWPNCDAAGVPLGRLRWHRSNAQTRQCYYDGYVLTVVDTRAMHMMAHLALLICRLEYCPPATKLHLCPNHKSYRNAWSLPPIIASSLPQGPLPVLGLSALLLLQGQRSSGFISGQKQPPRM